MGGTDEKLGRSGFEKDEIQFSFPNKFGEFHQPGHEKRGEDLLNELVGGDQNNHFLPAPPSDALHVLVDDTDKSELQDEPSQFDDNPGEKIGTEGKFTACSITELDEPETEEMEGSDHGSASGGGVFAETGFPKERRQKKKNPGPAKLHAEARHPGLPGDGSAKRGGREPVLVRKGENPGCGEKRGGKQVEGKDVSAGEKFEGVDEKDESADIQ
jgi:hypothetical protein